MNPYKLKGEECSVPSPVEHQSLSCRSVGLCTSLAQPLMERSVLLWILQTKSLDFLELCIISLRICMQGVKKPTVVLSIVTER